MLDTRRSFFVSIAQPPPETDQAIDWCANSIDRFVLARQEQKRLASSEMADRVTLLRRLYFDLIGLPPEPEVVATFVANQDPQAYEQVVERLLASPRFGERMAIYWLDLVRFANSVGYHGDQEHAIDPYRDYVIASFNENLAFDQFTIEQLAGDLLPNPTQDQLVATGYNRLLQTSHEGGVQQAEYLAKYAADRVRNVSAAWMGATLGCAECHDHKFDRFPQRDFYRLAAFFADVDDLQTFRGSNSTPTQRLPELTVLSRVDRKRSNHLLRRIELLKTADDGSDHLPGLLIHPVGATNGHAKTSEFIGIFSSSQLPKVRLDVKTQPFPRKVAGKTAKLVSQTSYTGHLEHILEDLRRFVTLVISQRRMPLSLVTDQLICRMNFGQAAFGGYQRHPTIRCQGNRRLKHPTKSRPH